MKIGPLENFLLWLPNLTPKLLVLTGITADTIAAAYANHMQSFTLVDF
jgi:hypothetical protein